jgi:hypothetical protein
MNSNSESELDSRKLEQNILFIVVYINRINMSQENDETMFTFLNSLFNYVDLNVIGFNLPNIFLVYDQFMIKYDFTVLDSLSTVSSYSKLSHVHLYDFVQLNMLRFFSKLDKIDSIFYFLCNNLTLKLSKKHSFRLQTSSDLVQNLFAINLTNEKLAVSMLKFISDLYEMDSKENLVNVYLKLTFYNLFHLLTLNSNEKKHRSILKNIHDYHVTKKHFMCYSVLCSSISSFQHQSKLFCDLIEPKSPNVNNFLINLFKKLINFFSSNSIDSLKTNAFQLSLINIFGSINLELINFSTYKNLTEHGTNLARILHDYFEKKSNDSSFNNNQVYKRSLPIFYKLILKLNLNAEIEFLLTLLLKNYTMLNLSLKFHLVNFMYSILTFKSKCSNVNDLQVIIGKMVDSVCLVLGDSSHENLKIFCLECLSENMPGSSSPSPIMSALLCSLTKKNKALNEQIMNYLVEIKPNITWIDEVQYLNEQFVALSQNVTSNFRPTTNQKVTMLDETMNVLMAMEATQSAGGRDCLNDDDQEMNEEARVACENKIEDINREVNSLSDLLKLHYTDKSQPIPERLKSKVNNLIELITMSI